MRYCPECGDIMIKSTTLTGEIIYQSKCLLTIAGESDDTLMAEGFLDTADSNLKHEVFIENSVHDPAANLVMKDCPDCGLNFMVMIRVGENEETMFLCDCGFRATNEEYTKLYKKS